MHILIYVLDIVKRGYSASVYVETQVAYMDERRLLPAMGALPEGALRQRHGARSSGAACHPWSA